MSGYVDVHAHWVPAVDDGVRSFEEALAVCEGMASLGYGRLTATPHIRTAMFPNEPERLREAFDALAPRLRSAGVEVALGLGAEHFFDDVLVERLASGRFLPYPGSDAFLVELPSEVPLSLLERWFFRLRVEGRRPVLAHPERYAFLWRHPEGLVRLRRTGAVPQLDVMSLMGRYGRRARAAAERFLEDGLYAVAGSDVHRPGDLEELARALERLEELVGTEGATELLREGPLRLLGEGVS